MPTLQERLQDPNDRFSPQEIYQLFELLSEQYGYHRDPDLPQPGRVAETASLTVKGFEKFGVLVVRPRTVQDSMVVIPSLVDKTLGNNFEPSQSTAFNANLLAIAKTVIVSPPRLVDRILESSDDEDFNFFLAFAKEYNSWMKSRAEEARKKNSGTTTLSESPSTSDTSDSASQQTPTG